MEHEAEKYQQRLQAIAEKRRLQDEQERARREIEDERLRLQQQKRKSLRDQWLMEGPTSPSSPEPRSPLWAPKAQSPTEALIEKSERLKEEENTLKFFEDSSTRPDKDVQMKHEVEIVADQVETAVTETAPNGPIMENGKDGKKEDSVIVENAQKEGLALEIEPGPSTTMLSQVFTSINGGTEDTTPEDTSEQEAVHINGSLGQLSEEVCPGGVTMTFLGFKEAELGQGVNEDEDDGGAIIRAERVIISDEGDEVLMDESRRTAEHDSKEDATLRTESKGDLKETENTTDVTEASDNDAEEAVAVSRNEEQELDHHVSLDNPAQPSPAASAELKPEVKDSTATASTRISLSQFHEVPLDGVGESSSTTGIERQRIEQEPLLVSKTSQQFGTSSTNRAEPAVAPKRKTCQCCSVM